MAIIYLVVRHERTKRKNKFRDKLRLREYWWAVVKTFEVGVKASGHIVLQCWLLSGILPTLGEVGMIDLAKMTFRHGCQMAIARFLDRMCLALWASGLWLRYAMLQNLIPSFPWIAPGWRAWGRNPRKGRDQILQRSVAEP